MSPHPYRTPDPPKGQRWGASFLARVHVHLRGTGALGHRLRKLRRKMVWTDAEVARLAAYYVTMLTRGGDK